MITIAPGLGFVPINKKAKKTSNRQIDGSRKNDTLLEMQISKSRNLESLASGERSFGALSGPPVDLNPSAAVTLLAFRSGAPQTLAVLLKRRRPETTENKSAHSQRSPRGPPIAAFAEPWDAKLHQLRLIQSKPLPHPPTAHAKTSK